MENERIKRWDSKHKCKCGKDINNYHKLCDGCQDEKEINDHIKREIKQWDGESMLFSHAWNEYFDDYYDMVEKLEINNEENDEDRKLEDLHVVICKPIFLRVVEEDYWMDDMVDDEDSSLPEDVVKALDYLNEVIKKQKPSSWIPGKFALELKNDS